MDARSGIPILQGSRRNLQLPRTSRMPLLIGLALVAVTASLPLWPGISNYLLAVVVRALILIALGQAWNIIAGFGGQLSLGNGVFFGIGGYATAILMVRFGLTPWLGAFVGAGLAALVALIMGAATFRFRGVYFALATVVISLGFEQVTRHFVDLTGGDAGFSEPFIGNSLWAMQARGPAPFLLLGLGLVVAYYLFTRWLLVSSLGLRLRAVHDEEVAAAAGVDVFRTKLLALVISAIMSAVVGVVYVQFYLTIDPGASFGLMQAIEIQLPALIGGLGTAAGPVIGGGVMVVTTELTNWITSGWSVHGVDVLAFGVILLLIVLRAPMGILGAFTGRRKRT